MKHLLKYKNWTPDPAQMAHKPDISGNEINGLGEKDFRPPRYVYWANGPGQTAHWDMQMWFYEHNTQPLITAARQERTKIDAMPIQPKAESRVYVSADEFTAKAKKAARDFGGADVGITAFNKDWLYEGATIDLPHVIVVAIEHDYEKLEHAPDPIAGAEVIKQYGQCQYVAKQLSSWIHEQGYNAHHHYGPMSGQYTMIPAALAAGLGELGKHGSVIHPHLGSNFRLTSVITDMPLHYDQPKDFGADDFCANCQICSKACPPDAISAEKQWVRGRKKYYVDFDKCLPFFNETAGCGICISVCPWSRPGVADNLVVKLAQRRARLARGETGH